MNSNNQPEHYVTLFDRNFLPMGMTLHGSLMRHGQPFHLWIICMDELVEEQLGRISLPHVTLIPLREVESRELLAVKPGRNRAEYCWTLTPFSFQAVFNRDGTIERVTYLDADLFFFADPHILLAELDAAGKHALITEHAYAPEHNRFLYLSGRFCVQFLTFRRTVEAAKVMQWWQEKCLEWCFDIFEEDRFGDQKYLDVWPELFADEVHIVRQTEKTLAPWNVTYFEKTVHGQLDPVFYHFHAFRIVSPHEVRLFNDSYTIGTAGLRLYDEYIAALLKSNSTLNELGIAIPWIKEDLSFKEKILKMIQRDPRYYKIS